MRRNMRRNGCCVWCKSPPLPAASQLCRATLSLFAVHIHKPSAQPLSARCPSSLSLQDSLDLVLLKQRFGVAQVRATVAYQRQYWLILWSARLRGRLHLFTDTVALIA